MKFHDRSRTMRPDASALLPLGILFITSLNGPTIPEALHRSLRFLFVLPTGPVIWAEVLLLNVLLFWYFAPVFRLHIGCLRACAPAEEVVDRALGRLNRLYLFPIAAAVAVFVAGRLGIMALERAAAGPGADFSGRGGLALAEAAASGFFVGVVLALQFEDRLFKARETLMGLGPRGKVAYVSLYSKFFLAVIAILLFMTFQAFAAAGSFYSLGAPPELAQRFLSGPEFLLEARRFSHLKEVLDVFLLRLLLLLFLVGKMVYQLKRLIARPIATVLQRLEILNAPEAAPAAAIGIVQNDEFSAVYREINGLIQKQQGELEISRRRLAAVVEGAADPIIALDGAGRIRLFNPAAEASLGYRRDEVLGRGLELFLGEHAGEFLAAHGAAAGEAAGEAGGEAHGAPTMDAASGAASVAHLVAGSGGGAGTAGHDHQAAGGGDFARFEWRTAGGGSLLMESHLSGAGGGEDPWTTVILRDISLQAEFEGSLRRAREEAETASRMKSEFLANMSHELRTPLNAILGFTQLLQGDQNLTGAQQERVRVIARSGEHLLAIINDILDISKIEAGRMELREGVFDLPEFVADLRDLFELRCRKKGLSLYLDSAGELPRYVRGDLGKLRQVLVNLVGNAVKFTAQGGIGILVGAEGDRIRFAVRDTGRGIPKAEQEAILLPFVQASTTDHEGGTGLGLAISTRYVALMGGCLEVESEPGKGSTFSFAIPLPEAEGEAEAVDAEEVLVEAAPGRELRVLVVDDQEANRLVLKEMLERAGFTVLEARDGREAVDRAREVRPEIVFMDIKMPVLDGYAATAELKADPATAGIRIFALTASAFTQDEERIREAGFDGFLAKPFKLGSLHRLIREKGGVPLRAAASEAGLEGRAGGEEPLEYASARRQLGEAGLARLEEAALINDFASIGQIAGSLRREAPGFAAALAEAAASYEEAAIAALIQGLREASA